MTAACGLFNDAVGSFVSELETGVKGKGRGLI